MIERDFVEITSEEIANPQDYNRVNTNRAMVLTFGIEIEQPADRISRALKERYDWHYDLSGPLETNLPPSTMPNMMIKKFVDTVNETHSQWEWVGEYTRGYERIGCGSHIHFRPRDDLYANTTYWAETWATLHNTCVELVPFLAPLLAWGNPVYGKHHFRELIWKWAKTNDFKRYNADTFERNFLTPSYRDHPYYYVAPDRKTEEHVLTIEIRLAECHPVVASYFGTIMEKIVARCYARGFKSPKLIGDREGRYNRERVFNIIFEAMYYHAKHVGHPDMPIRVGDYIEQRLREEGIDKLYFEPSIPLPRGIEIKEAKGYYDVFDTITNWTTADVNFQRRIYDFYWQRGIPLKNAMDFWNVYAERGQFRWSDPNIRSTWDKT